ncbi:MAG: peptide chain release factor N(5)-glutamine methyltransferase [Deltaproteobacteria bacterium]|nr:peptide chain release factor N(5)-glutamine methyltransferase [Deltaproteobacteria bacterium]
MQNHLQPSKSSWTILELIKWTTSYFTTHDIDSPRTTAELFLADVLNIKRIDLYLQYDRPLIPSELEGFKALIKRRVSREPVAYIRGYKEFWSMDLKVTPDVLIPRPETECLVEAALSHLLDADGGKAKKVLDLGTGSGAIVLALASQCPDHLFFASDLSSKALEVASENAKRHGFEKRVHFFSGDWFYTFRNNAGLFDFIVSNPPYIRSDDIGRLQPEVCEYEPRMALESEKDGLGAIRHIVQEAHTYLNHDGYLLLEIDHYQKDDVRHIIDQTDQYREVSFSKDYGGYYRVVEMKKRSN